MVKLNMQVRLRSRQFWLGIVGATGTFALSLANAFGLEVYASPWVEAIEGVLAATLTVLTLIGVLTDPTTAGISDSSQALQYVKPRSDDSADQTEKEM